MPYRHPARVEGEGTSLGRPQARRAGFSTLELAISIAFLLLALGPALRGQVQASELLATARETQIASGDLQACMERVLATPHDALAVPGSDYEDGQPVAAFEELNLSGERIVATYPDYVAGAPLPDPLEVVLTITWDDPDRRERSLRLSSARAR
jgi:hypothetical protein